MRITTALLLMSLILTTSLAQAGPVLAPFTTDDVTAAPDYSRSSSWIARPDTPGQHPVDIFWVYPTILFDNEHWLMDIASPAMQEAAHDTLTTQASVFSGQANLYAPLYRQMNMHALSLPSEKHAALIKYGMDDVWRAFTHYLEHDNNGRPFILAGHSQGSDILTQLFVRYWGSTGAEDRLVAAYVIGWSVTPDDMDLNPAVVMCEDASQTNCLVSYNTVAAGRQEAAPTIIEGAMVTNPLTWSTEPELAPASLNLGATFFLEDGTTKTIPHFTSAQVVDSGLVVEPADPAMVPNGTGGFPDGVYHKYDYSLFYENLRENVAERIDAFLNR